MVRQHERVVVLCDALKRLAAPAWEQRSYLASLGVLPLVDELALEFDDLVAFVPRLLEDGHLTRRQAEAIYAVDHKLTEMSRPDGPWDEADLGNHPDWADVRSLANAAIRQLS